MEFCDGASVSSPTFVLSGSAYGYTVNWTNGKPNGIDFDQAANIILGTSTFTLIGTLDTGVTTTTFYPYTITTIGSEWM